MTGLLAALIIAVLTLGVETSRRGLESIDAEEAGKPVLAVSQNA